VCGAGWCQVVVAKTNAAKGAHGMSLFLVEAGTHGFTKGSPLKKMGLKAQASMHGRRRGGRGSFMRLQGVVHAITRDWSCQLWPQLWPQLWLRDHSGRCTRDTILPTAPACELREEFEMVYPKYMFLVGLDPTPTPPTPPLLHAHRQDTCELFFEDVAVPADALLGEEDKGFYYLMNELPQVLFTCMPTDVRASTFPGGKVNLQANLQALLLSTLSF